jgi:hypothetical protein
MIPDVHASASRSQVRRRRMLSLEWHTFLSVSTTPEGQLSAKGPVASDEPSDNAPRPQQMQPDSARQDHCPDVPKRKCQMGTAPQEALDCACGLYRNDPTAWLDPPSPTN